MGIGAFADITMATLSGQVKLIQLSDNPDNAVGTNAKVLVRSNETYAALTPPLATA